MSRDRASLHRLLDAVPDDDLDTLAHLIEVFGASGALTSAAETELVRDARERDSRFGDDLAAETASLAGAPRRTR